MKIIITGGAGFLGDRLARALLAQRDLSLAGAPAVPITELVLIDRVPPRDDVLADSRVRAEVGDLGDLLPRGVMKGADLVFHLAAVVSGDAERDLELGMRVNLTTTIDLLEACRALAAPPRLVFASSLAVFGATPLEPLPAIITDTTLPTPQSSYGTQKFMSEQVVADYARRGLVPGRSVRLMTVAVRPGVPNAAASSFLSGIVREPLAGVRAVCPVPPETRVALTSPGRTIDGLLLAATASDERWGSLRALTLPALTLTVGEMVDALTRVAGPETSALIDWVPNPSIEAIVGSWPAQFEAARAKALGLGAEPDFDTIVRSYVASLA